jgi:ABC-2 type transport system ATP-binding protein/sodium transport system ATP-binding protein
MGVTRFLDQRSSTLSTGQKQRVQLARALIHNPPIMLLDEPTRGLDVFGSQAIFDYISKLREDRRAVIVCTHRLHEAERLCDRFGLMHRGRLVLEGTLAELQQSTGCETLVEMFMKFVGDSSNDTTTEYPAA